MLLSRRLYHVERVVKLLTKKVDINIADEGELVLLSLQKAMRKLMNFLNSLLYNAGKLC